MKRGLIFPLLLMLGFPGILHSEEFPLEEWTLSRDGTAQSFKAKVPSTVAGVLMDNGYFGDSFLEADNYFKADKSIFDDTWTYGTSFDVKKKAGRYYSLRFDGMNFYADIVLNGEKIASSDTTAGVFIRRKYDVNDNIGHHNVLKVSLQRAKSGDLNIGFVDWNPRPLDESMGLVRGVTLVETGAVSIEDLFVKPIVDTDTWKTAVLHTSITVRNHSPKTVKTVIRGRYDQGGFKKAITLAPYETRVVEEECLMKEPRLWWSHDLGTPYLYTMDVQVKAGWKFSDSASTEFGIRSITSYIREGGYRQFVLNGREILVKGAGWTDDIFLRDTHKSIDTQLALVMDMGLNCVRFENIWGKDSYVYDQCDRLGILTMVGFSCQWEWEDYCGLPETKNLGCINDPRSMDFAARYFHDQVLWMRNHTSIIAWLTGSDCIPNEELEARYIEAYDKYEYRPYVCSAKNLKSKFGGPSGMKMAGPYDYVDPSYWYTDTHCGGAFGFNTETGIGANIPQKESLIRMLGGEDKLWPAGKEWNQHCTTSSSAMNSPETLLREVAAQYGEATDADSFISRSHALDYDATRAMFEAFRVNAPVATGIIQWMLNSAWPSIFWQLYDYYMVPTAGYYGTKKACAPRQLVYNYGDRKVYLVSDIHDGKALVAVLKAYDPESRQLANESVSVTAGEHSSVVFEDVCLPGGGFLSLTLSDEAGNEVSNNFYCVESSSAVYDWKHSNWYYTPMLSDRDLGFVTRLPRVELEMDVEKIDGGYSVKLSNTSEYISYANRLALVRTDGSLVAPAFWSDNFISLLPGHTRIVTCLASEEGEIRYYSFK